MRQWGHVGRAMGLAGVACVALVGCEQILGIGELRESPEVCPHKCGTDLWSLSLFNQEISGGMSEVRQVEFDQEGNLAVAGICRGFVDFGNGYEPCGAGNGLFVGKVDPLGKWAWHHMIDSDGNESSPKIAVTSDGGIVLLGETDAIQGSSISVDASNPGPVAGGNGDFFVYNFDAVGSVTWYHLFGDSEVQRFGGIAADAEGNFVVAGSFQGSVQCDPQGAQAPVTTTSSFDGFVCKFNKNGALSWQKRLQGTANQEPQAVGIDTMGRIYVAGVFDSNLQADGMSLSNTTGANDVFLVRFDSDGVVSGTDSTSSLEADVVRDIDIGSNDVVFVVGGEGTQATITEFTLDNGMQPFKRKFGDGMFQIATSAAVTKEGNVVIAGRFNGSIDFGVGRLDSNGGNDIFVAAFGPEPSHVPLWSRSIPIAGDSDSPAVAARERCNIAIGGARATMQALELGNDCRTSVSSYETAGFLAKIIPPSNP